MSPMVTTKQKSILDTQKIMRKESKHNTKESPQTKREETKRRRKKQRGTKKQTKKKANKYLSIYNHFNCNWTKFSDQKSVEWIKKKKKKNKTHQYVASSRHFSFKDMWRLKVKTWKNMFPANQNQKKADIAFL